MAISPPPALKNVGVTDVPWQASSRPPAPPTTTTSTRSWSGTCTACPNGRLQQIGASGLKHAFLTLNTNCGCPAGNILWVARGCEDIYSISTNNSTNSLGPRSEITAHTGVWQRCGSVFDPNCDGIQNAVPGFNGRADPRRLIVLDTDLQTAGAQYYFDSWYVVRDDVNIFNTMGYRQVTPTLRRHDLELRPCGRAHLRRGGRRLGQPGQPRAQRRQPAPRHRARAGSPWPCGPPTWAAAAGATTTRS